MGKPVSLCIILFIAGGFSLFLVSEASNSKSTIIQQPRPLQVRRPLDNLLLNKNIPNACSYTITIKTSCSSTSFTRDKISLAFGDAYNNEVYAPRLDDPSSGTFERCSTDTFQISGPCMRTRICYFNLLRVGSDGWKPESVTVSARNYKTVKFNYNTFLPNGVWYGFDLCNKMTIDENVVVSAV